MQRSCVADQRENRVGESGVCANCGYELPEADALGLITCSGCGAVTKLGSTPTLDEPSGPPPESQAWPAPPVAAPPPGDQWAVPAPIAGAPAAPPPSSPAEGRGRRASGSERSGDQRSAARRIGCAVVPIAIVMAISFGIFGAVRSCDIGDTTSGFDPFAFDSSVLTLSGSGSVLPATGGSTDAVMILQDTEDSTTTRHIARIAFEGDRSRLVWKSDPVGESAYRVEVAVVGDTLFAGVDDEVYALDAKTGETQWKAALRDKLTAGCDRCFAAVDGRLVVRTTDAYITAFGTRSSEPVWSKRLRSTSGSMSVVGDRLFLVDEPESDDEATAAALVDPADGQTIRATTPRCPKGEGSWDVVMSPGDEVRAVPGSTDVMGVFGFGDGCVVRWDPSTSTVKWTSALRGLGSIDQDSVLVGRNDLVIGSNGEPIVTVFLPNGKARVLEAISDTTAEPGAIVGRTLVAQTVTNRGTPKGGLAAWDLSTGERTWANTSLGTAQPVSKGTYHSSDALFDGTPRSLLVPVDGGLNVFVFEGTDKTFSVAPVDMGTGDLGTEVRRGFLSRYDSGTVSLTIEGRHTDHLVVSIDDLLQTLPVSGKGDVVSYPEKK